MTVWQWNLLTMAAGLLAGPAVFGQDMSRGHGEADGTLYGESAWFDSSHPAQEDEVYDYYAYREWEPYDYDYGYFDYDPHMSYYGYYDAEGDYHDFDRGHVPYGHDDSDDFYSYYSADWYERDNAFDNWYEF